MEVRLRGAAEAVLATDTIEVMPTDRKTLEFSYADRDAFAFIDPESTSGFLVELVQMPRA